MAVVIITSASDLNQTNVAVTLTASTEGARKEENEEDGEENEH